MPVVLDLDIYQGATFQYVLRWESLPLIYKDISAITQDAPARVTAASHGVPDGWRVAITNARGMVQINARNTPPKESDFVKATVVDGDNLDLNSVNAQGYSAYTGNGLLRYYTPVGLSGFTARMKIKRTLTSAAAYIELTTVNGRIVLDDSAKTITLLVSAVDTAALDFTTAVYDLELVSGSGVVTRLVEGEVTLHKEVTTT